MSPSIVRSVCLVLCLCLLSAQARASSEPPEWAQGAVWYQIFPERFRNGDRANDPARDDIRGSWPHDATGDWHVSPWTSDWYELQSWERKNGKGFWYNAQLRRYGGDLQGVLDKLDYIKSLGVTAIYLNPVFESPSLHKYDATMYHHVDDNFGPDPKGDRAIWASEDPADPSTWKWTTADLLFLKLVREAHRRDLKVIIDGVFNHVGLTFWAFRDATTKGRASAYWDWFTITALDDPTTPADELRYKAWLNIGELPEVRDVGDDLAPGPREHIRAVVRRWMDPNGDGNPSDGIDGWRLDVAEFVGHKFWRDFRTWTREINPQSYTSGEVFWEDWKNNKMFEPSPWVKGDEFDAVMHYPWTVPVRAFFLGKSTRIDAPELDIRLKAIRSAYRPETNLVMMNLFDSHDTDRIGSQAVNPDVAYDHLTSPKDNPAYSPRAPNAAEWKRVRLMTTFQFTYPGAPMIYAGGEAGMWGADDPDERKPMVWPDLKYSPERAMPDGKSRRADRVRFDSSLFAHYQELSRLRAAHTALRRGAIEGIPTGNPRVAAFARVLGAERVVAAFNASDSPAVVNLTPGRDLLSGRVYRSGRIRLAPWSAVVMKTSHE